MTKKSIERHLCSQSIRSAAKRFAPTLAVALLLASVLTSAQKPSPPVSNVPMISGIEDPNLQRQNEVSIAVSTRDSCTLLAGANDYRTLDFLDAHPLPGLDPTATAADPWRDTWLGYYISTSCGQDWESGLLPGHSQDTTTTPANNPLKAFVEANGTAGNPVFGADPVVRAGTNGMFYYAGMLATRDLKHSKIFVARFIDNNDQERFIDKDNKAHGNPVQFIDVHTVADADLAKGEFFDKVWLAVSLPWQYSTGSNDDGEGDNDNADSGNKPSSFTVSDPPRIPTQQIPTSYVYVVWTKFTGGDSANRRGTIMFSRSTDGGVTFSTPRALSDGKGIAQGATFAIAQDHKTLYLAWREFAINGRPDAIYVTRSPDGGAEFYRPQRIATIIPFDQRDIGFRTNTLPTMAAWTGGGVGVAFAARNVENGPSRIQLAVSTDSGKTWGPRRIVDHWPGAPSTDGHPDHPGHQVMPSLSYAAGVLNLAYFDSRNDAAASPDDPFISSPNSTIDVRGAQAAPGATPTFMSFPISQYRTFTDDSGQVLTESNHPNNHIYQLGTKGFIGDYTDNSPVSAIPFRLPTGQQLWLPNVSRGEILNTVPSAYRTLVSQTLDRTIGHLPQPNFHVGWGDNRNAPLLNPDALYFPPGHPEWASNRSCDPNFASMLNANPYFASVLAELFFGVAQNTKPLGFGPDGVHFQRAFGLFVQNPQKVTRYFRLIIANQPGTQFGDRASFAQFPAPPFLSSTPLPAPVIQRDFEVAPLSTIATNVYVTAANPTARVRVDLVEIVPGDPNDPAVLSQIKPDGFRASVQLNPDSTNPPVKNPDTLSSDVPDLTEQETYHPLIFEPVVTPGILSTRKDLDVDNPLGGTSLRVEEQPREGGPREGGPREGGPREGGPREGGAAYENTALSAVPELASKLYTIRDYQFKLSNESNTASEYFFSPTVDRIIAGAHYQLLVTQRYYQPNVGGTACDFVLSHQNRVIANISGFIPREGGPREGGPREGGPREGGPREGGPREGGPREGGAAFLMAPGESVTATLRVYEPIDGGAGNEAANAGAATLSRIANAGLTESTVTRPRVQPERPAPTAANRVDLWDLLGAPLHSAPPGKLWESLRKFLPSALTGPRLAFTPAPPPLADIPSDLIPGEAPGTIQVAAALTATAVDTKKAEAGITEPASAAAGPDLIVFDNRQTVPPPSSPTPSISPLSVAPGETVTLDWTLTNRGTAEAVSPSETIKARFYFSPDGSLSPDDRILSRPNGSTELVTPSPLPACAGQGSAGGACSRTFETELVVPAGVAPGSYFVIVVADDDNDAGENGNGDPENEVFEADEFNNTAAVALNVQPFVLLFSGPVNDAAAGSALESTSPVIVKIHDSRGTSVDPARVPAVTIEIANNPAGGTLSGTLTQPNIGGAAIFADLRINLPGVGYTLRAVAVGAAPVISNPFRIDGVPTALADSYSTNEDQPLSVAAPGVLGNDSDPEQGPLTANVVQTTSNGALVLNANGSFTYTPSPNFNGTDTFTYQASDGRSVSGVTTVTINVVAVDDAPVAADDSGSTSTGEPVTIDVGANDTDADGNSLTIASVTDPANGSAAIQGDNTILYTPDAGFTGTDSFSYTVNDGTGRTATGTVTVLVGGAECIAPPSDLVAWWPGDGNANDVKGTNHGETLGGVAFTAGRVAQAFTFDGVDDYVRVADNAALRPPSALTIDFWFKSDVLLDGSITHRVPFLVNLTETQPIDAVANGYDIFYSSGFLRFRLRGSASTPTIGAGVTFQAGVWYHVAATYGAEGQRLYVNGVQVVGQSGFGEIQYTPAPILIGRLHEGSGVRFFDGQIDEIDLFNRELSAAEVHDLYDAGTAGKCKTADLIVSSLTHTPVLPTAGDTIIFTAVVTNVGGGAAGPSTLMFKIGGETAGAEGTLFAIPQLAAGASHTVERAKTLTAGNYRNTATADFNAEVAEDDETNNTTTEDYAVGQPPSDLVVESVTHSPSDPTTADTMTFTAVVRNIGAGPAGASTLMFKVGGEGPGAEGTLFAVPALAPGASHTVERQRRLTVAQGYQNTATADFSGAVVETNENNNTTIDLYTVGQPPDLLVTSMTHAPSNPTAGDRVTFTAVVRNQGLGRARASVLMFSIGGESPGNPATLFAVRALESGATFTVERQMTLTVAQNYGNQAIADFNNDVGETDETNNTATDAYAVAPLLVGKLDDPEGDVTDGDPDLVAATLEARADSLLLEVRFAPGTFNSSTTIANFSLDIDENAGTGHPGTDATCEADKHEIGTDFVVEAGSTRNGTQASVRRFSACNVGGETVQLGEVVYVADGMDIKIPLSAIGEDDGRLYFKVSTVRYIGPGSTGILDRMSDVGLPPGKVPDPTYSGSLTDASGDATAATDPDLVSAHVDVRETNLEVRLRFAPGTFSETSVASFSLDTDENASTGHQGTDSNCVRDKGVIGVEFVVYAGSSAYGSQARVFPFTGPECNQFGSAAVAGTVIYVPDGMNIKIPLSALGGDDGRLRFKVNSARHLGGGGFTGILDSMTEPGKPPGKVPGPVSSGGIGDASGDVASGDPDLVSASVDVRENNLELSLRFAPGSFNRATSAAQFLLDTDENPLTGHRGTDSGCSNDNGVLGVEFLVNLGEVYDATRARVIPFVGPGCNQFGGASLVGSVVFVANGMDVKIPLSALGGDDGGVKFKVSSSRSLGGGSFTGILDRMTDIGLPPGKVPAPTYTGTTSDASGDVPLGDPDLVSAFVDVRRGNLEVSVRFAAGFSSSTSVVHFSLDTDENPGTGHPGSDSGCVNDNGIIGAEFSLSAGSDFNGTQARILPFVGPGCNQFGPATLTGTVVYIANGMDITIPLSAIGGDDGRLRFKVTSSRYLGNGGFTGVLDRMTEPGTPAGRVQ